MQTSDLVFWFLLFTYCSAYYLAAGLAINIAYHRCLSHRSFTLRKSFERFFVILGLPAGTPVQWVGNHRFHHRNADETDDPHSPVKDGFWFAHVGWYIGTKNPFVCFIYSIAGPLRTLYDGWNRPQTNQQYNHLAADISKDKFYRFISRPVPFMLACWLHAAISFGFAYFVWGLWGIIALWIMLIIIYNLGDAIDSVAHLYGKRPFSAKHFARNNKLLGLLTLGEGWHANHHVFPSSAKHGLLPNQFDAVWEMIRLFEKLKIIRDVKIPNDEQIHSKLIKAKQEDKKMLEKTYSEHFEMIESNVADPDPWLALYLDRSIQIDDEAKAALLLSMRSKSREFLFPLLKPFLWLILHIVTLLRILFPNLFASSKILHRTIHFGLKTFVRPEANFIILRHFHLGSEILEFIASNVKDTDIKLNPLRPEKLEDVLDDLFLKHDLNLFNFVINLNTELRRQNRELETPEKLNFDAITDGKFPFESFPNRWTNFLDVQSAIEIYTPVYQLFLPGNDFWRAANSLQLDETVGLYVSRLLGSNQYLGLLNNKHPLVPLPTTGAGYRLLLHGLASEELHSILREQKRKQQESK